MTENNPRAINYLHFPKEKDLSNQIRFVLGYAVLAPSTHNTQPWLFKIKGNKCEIFYNPELQLPEADKKGRDLYISIGCAIENLILAATYFNIFQSVDYGSHQENLPVATVFFKQGGGHVNDKYKKFIDLIPKRINARGIFSGETLSQDLLNKISLTVNDYLTDGIQISWVTDQEKINNLASLTADGLRSAYKRKTFRKEMSGWMNNSMSTRKEGIPGYALKMPFLLSFVLPKIVKFFDIGNFLARKNYQSLSSASLIAVITSDGASQTTWIKIGRLAERLFLELNNIGWQTSIFVAAIEMNSLDREVQKIIQSNQDPQFLFAVGRVDSLHKPTPRHSLSSKIID